jgi:hypothetical protein
VRPSRIYHFEGGPKNAEEKAMRDWWLAMKKLDSSFEWRLPINFFGKVIDQHGEGIPDASVEFLWNVEGGTSEEHVKSSLDGSFKLQNKQGKILSVRVNKHGCRGDNKSNFRSFEFSEFWDRDFYVPDARKPEVLRLWKLEKTEPMYFWARVTHLQVNGPKVWFDAKTGVFGSTGDLAFSATPGHDLSLAFL